jgi:hypothetical protein
MSQLPEIEPNALEEFFDKVAQQQHRQQPQSHNNNNNILFAPNIHASPHELTDEFSLRFAKIRDSI